MTPKMIPYVSFFLLIVPFTGARYYTRFDLDKSGNLCEELHRQPLQFGDVVESAIRLRLYGKKSFHCQFEVIPRSSKHGIVAVIQDMNFRKDPLTGRCVDFIKFKGTKMGGESKKYCGSYDVEMAMEKYVYQGQTYIGMATQNAYQNDADDGVIVIIHMNMNDDNYYDAGAELVLTSYTDCHSDPPWFYKPCVAENLDTICIEDVYFDDGIVNCPFRGCTDEGTCVPLIVKYYGKRIFLGMLVGVILFICLSAACFIYCTPIKTYNAPMDPPPNYMLPPLDEGETEDDTDEDEIRRREGNTSEESTENWDKPPLYESLFPDGQSPFAQA